MPSLLDLLSGVQPKPTTFIDIGLTALLIYWLFSLIRDTRAVRLVIGVTVLYGVYVVAQLLGLQLLSQILQASAVVGLFALVVVFQPELRRALERLGHVGSLGWMLAPGQQGAIEHVANEIARAAAGFSADRHGALIVLERETGLEDFAESGVMVHADLSAELLRTIFMPRSPLHDGAVIIRGGRILAAGVVLPLAEVAPGAERFGTRHRAAFGVTEETDALVVVVSEETGAISLVERGRIVRNLDEEQLRVALITLLRLDASLRAGAEEPIYEHWPRLSRRPPRAPGSVGRRIGRHGPNPDAAGTAAAGRADRP
ncbi:MAG: diadenylate cyclase CdaA [Candidatus Limnocylindrales bacterium]